MPTTTVHRQLTLTTAASAVLRTAQFDGKDHLVVPIVLMVGNAVVRPMGSRGPEFVPTHVLAVAPGGWDGRPVVMDHPNGGKSSANTPTTLEKYRYGHLFNTRVKNNKLVSEMWLDSTLAERVGPEAVDVLARCKKGDIVEISVGAYIQLTEEVGEYEGQAYEYVWGPPVPDHCATLPDGAEGACSVDMGCGAPRAARAAQQPLKGDRNMPSLLSMLQRTANLFKSNAESGEGTSVSELHTALYDALRAVEPGFDWILDIFPDSSTVIYSVRPEDRYLTIRRTYTKGDGDTVSLNDDREEVEPIVRYEPVTAAADSTDDTSISDPALVATNAGCKCQHEGDTVMTVKDLAGKLIASGKFTEKDRAGLEAMSEEGLTSLTALAGAEAPAAPSTPPTAPSQPTAPSTPPPAPQQPTKVDETPAPTEEEQIAALPASLRKMVDGFRTLQSQRKDALITALSKSQTAFTVDQLKAKDVEELETYSKLLGLTDPAVDYSLRAAGGSDASDDYPAPPDTYGLNKAPATTQ